MLKIDVSAEEMWDYFKTHKEELGKTQHIVAENTDYGVVISITEERGFPCFLVTADDYQYAEEYAVSASDCKDTVEMLYDNYLTEKFIATGDISQDELTLLEQEDMISERELELDDAVLYFLQTILEDDADLVLGNIDKICEDVKDHFLEYLYRKHQISVRRPMILEDEDSGEEFFEEYPYENMVFNDEDNPLYKV